MADRNIKIPDFDGDNMNILEWLQTVRMCALSAEWEDAATCERAKLHLTGKARTWLQNRIMAKTAGINHWDPAVVNNAKPPNLQELLTQRFLKAVTATEQARLRATLTQSESEDASSFFDRCEATQFALDAVLPEAFRTTEGNKANYDIVRGQNILHNFINGLKQPTKNHVLTLNVANAQEALTTAIAFEQANEKRGRVAAATGTTTEEDLVAKVAAYVMRGQSQHRGNSTRGGNAGGPNKDCFYCGFLGHQIKACRQKQGDESKGIFQQKSSTYSPGRVGTRGRGRSNERGRGGYRGRGSTAAYGEGTPPQQQQQQQQQQQVAWEQQQQQFAATFPPPTGGPDNQQAAFRYFPAGN